MNAAEQLATPARRSFGTARLVERDGRRMWAITAAPSVMLRLRRLFQGTDRAGKTIHVADTLEACRDLAWVCERWPLDVDPADHAFDRARRHRDSESAIERILAAEYVPRAVSLAVEPREYQRIAADLALVTRGLLLADDLGIGKTASAICVLVNAEVRPALVVTLTHLPRQWEAELKKFAPQLRVHRIRDGALYDLASWGGKRRKAGQLELAGAGAQLPDVIVTSYSKLAKWADALSGVVRSVVFDEVQELRHEKTGQFPSQRYAAARQIGEAAELRMGLSATPIYNNGGEIFSVLGALNPGALGTWREFAATWCHAENADRAKANLRDPREFGAWAREQGYMLRRTRSDVGRELPPITRAIHHVDVEQQPLTAIEGRAAELAKIILAEGGAGVDKMNASGELDWKLRQATGLAKAPFVADFVRMLAESGETVLVYAWHHVVYDVLEERLRDLGVVRFTGEESSAHKARSLEAFKAGASRILLMSLRAGAGVDGLQHTCRTVVFAELDWSPGVHEQALGRVARDGQKDPVVGYYLVADQGSDPIVADVLGVKTVQVDGIRDPDAAVLGTPQMDPHHVRKLAERYLAKKETA